MNRERRNYRNRQAEVFLQIGGSTLWQHATETGNERCPGFPRAPIGPLLRSRKGRRPAQKCLQGRDCRSAPKCRPHQPNDRLDWTRLTARKIGRAHV
jgi:hypothetical protein